ncbi:MAG: ribonuclease HIII [Simkaniaceae bacterium]|nr:ribonuclease HIII [Simkaniaceae bacterium]
MTQKPSCFTATIDTKLADKLKSDLSDRGFEFANPPYTIFSAKKRGVSLSLYTSGKLTVQGKEKDEFIEFYLEPEILKDLSYTNPTVDLHPRIGVDEAGKGDYFGPLVVAACYADEALINQLNSLGIKESKRISDEHSIRFAEEIKKICPYSVLVLNPIKYNELYTKFPNLNHMLAWGHATTVHNTLEKQPCDQILIDQFTKEDLVARNLRKKGYTGNITQRPRADSDIVVAAASLLARAGFLHALKDLEKRWGVALPKGATHVIKPGKRFVDRFGPEALNEVAKLHFKTTKELMR